MRSFWLNFEVTLLVYDPDFASLLRFLQVAYIEDAEEVDLEAWKRRPIWKVVVENAARLLGPLV
jgi:cardiolipin synthase